MPCTNARYPTDGNNHSGCNTEIDKLARMLCEAMQYAENMDGDNIYLNISPELKIWWDNHKEFDRLRQEKIRKKALSKLTKEEREALGVM